MASTPDRYLEKQADEIRARLDAAIDAGNYHEARREFDALEANYNEQAARASHDYHCELCGRGFNEAHDLHAHMITHTWPTELTAR